MNNVTNTTTEFHVINPTRIEPEGKNNTSGFRLEKTDYARDTLSQRNTVNSSIFSLSTSHSETKKYTENQAFSHPHLDLSPQNTKQYNREIVRLTILSSYDKIVVERRALVEKKFHGSLSQSEEKKLKYLDWQLDRIDDARGGDCLDKLESIVQAHEQLAQKVGVVVERMKNVIPQSSKRKKRRKKS